MESNEKIAAICRIQSDFKRLGNVSEQHLVKQISLSSIDEIDFNLVQAYLTHHPDLIESWRIQSCDQRSSPNWYLQAPDDQGATKWTVGLFPPNGEPLHHFDDGVSACAYYIRRSLKHRFGL